MRQMPPHLYKRYVLAEFGEFEGVVYPNFNRKLNILPLSNWRPPSHWPVYRGIDHGVTRSPTVCLWATMTPWRQVIVFKEYYQRGVDNDFARVLTVKEHARNIRAITAQMGVGVAWTVIDPSTRQHSGNDGYSVHDWYAQEGIHCLLGSRDLTGRVVKVATLFQPHPGLPNPITGAKDRAGGYPAAFFTQDCVKTIQEHEEWMWKEIKEGQAEKEIPEERNDHTCDAFSYIAAQQPLGSPLSIIDTGSEAYKLDQHRKKMMRAQQNGWRAQMGMLD